MARCAQCQEENEDLQTVLVSGKRQKVCEGCAEIIAEDAEIAAEAEQVMRGMMEYDGS